MPPLDPDDLAEIAFRPNAGTSGLADDDRASLDVYRRVIDAARSSAPADHDDEDAPPEVWSAIAGDLFSGTSAGEPAEVDLVRSEVERGLAPPNLAKPDIAEPRVSEARTDEPRADVVVTPIAHRRRYSLTILGAIAAVIALVAGVIIFAANRDHAPTTGTATVVAQAELGVLPPGDPDGAPGSGVGTAELERIGDRLDIVVQTTDVAAPRRGAHYEVWLLNRTGPVQPQSIGVLDSPNGEMRAPVPVSIDISMFDVVDISVEPDDDDRDHSGRSLLRGRLQ